VVPVRDIESAREAIREIVEQGEGFGAAIYDVESELAHYFRFQQLVKGRYYQSGDMPDNPTGAPADVDWEAVYPFKKNARMDDYPAGSELYDAALAFNRSYADFLGLLTRAFTGHPELLLEAVPGMFELRNKMGQLIRNPLPDGSGLNAAPTFDMASVATEVRP